jgi:ATP-dependent helicase/nuclease subunit B
VLGGLVEGIWPPATDPGPWLSRPMRTKVGLPSPEEAVGQAAHDFTGAACAAKQVVLSCPRRRDGAPAVPARWLARLDAYLDARGMAGLPAHPAAEWARALDQPADRAKPVSAPRPAPAVVLRPRKLSVTEIETWVRDPFAIYARHVLRLRALDPLDAEQDVLDYGTLVHDGLHRFLEANGTARGADAERLLREALQTELLRPELDLRETLRAWWAPRLDRIAAWVIAEEARRPRADRIASEVAGEWFLADLDFRLRGRADRIEQRADGALALLDYKTGWVPSDKDVEAGRSPQLPMEAAMAARGAFAAAVTGNVVELTYWRLIGGDTGGEARSLFRGDAARTADIVAAAEDGLRRLIAAYDDPAQPYLARPFPGAAPRFSDYVQLARVAEWSGGGDDE